MSEGVLPNLNESSEGVNSVSEETGMEVEHSGESSYGADTDVVKPAEESPEIQSDVTVLATDGAEDSDKLDMTGGSWSARSNGELRDLESEGPKGPAVDATMNGSAIGESGLENSRDPTAEGDSGPADGKLQIADLTASSGDNPELSLEVSSLNGSTADESKETSLSNHPEWRDAKEIKKKDRPRKRGHTDPDTESVSEDDLPEDGKMDTEAISDDELRTGGISGAETVSDDDFPPAQKRSKTKSKARKKDSLDFKLIHWDSILERVRSSKSLPELEKYWKVVREDPSDFTGWTYLLQYVDQENDIIAARDAYNSFLSMYPYCYGYWRKYADYEKRKGDLAKCDQVFKRGLRAIPLSVDLWTHYLVHCKATMKDNEDLLREQFELAIEKCGMEFRSDKLWVLYIQWEIENRRYQRVLAIYDRLLEIPILNLKTHFEDLQDLINRHRPCKILSVDEFFAVRSYVVGKLKSRNIPIDTSSNPPGEGEDASLSLSDEETVYMRERIVASRYKVYKATMSKIADRWQYETSIKRPYFHIKPLEKSQLENWTKYLDYEISAGDFKRTVILFERAMIACAMYQKFWLKYARYLEQCSCDQHLIRNVYKRACLVHLPKNPHLALYWAAFEEQQGNLNLARRILIHVTETSSNLLLVQLRHINFERRCGNKAKVQELFEHYIAASTQKCTVLALVGKYALFCLRCLNDAEKAIGILKDALLKYPEESRLYYMLLEVVRLDSPSFDERCIDVFNRVLESRFVAMETKLKFAQMKLEYCQDVGPDLAIMLSAQKEYINLLQSYNEQQQAEKYKTEGMHYYNLTNALKVADVTDADVKRGKAQLKAQVLYAGERADTLLADIVNQAALLGAARAPADLLADIDAVSTQSVQQALRSFVESKKKSIASVGAVSKVPYADDL